MTQKWACHLTVATMFFVSVHLGFAAESKTVRVFKFDGSLRCDPGKGVSSEEMAKELTSLGIKIIAQEKKKTVPMLFPGVCGGPTGRINLYHISFEDLKKIPTPQQGSSAFALWYFDYDTVFVFKYDGTLQCGLGKEITLDEMSKDLKGAGIVPVASTKGNDGMLHPSVCGASTGTINVFEIKSGDHPKAKQLHFAFGKPGKMPTGVPTTVHGLNKKTTNDLLPWPW